MRREEWDDERVLERPEVMAAMARAALPLVEGELAALGEHPLVAGLRRAAGRVLASLEADRLTRAQRHMAALLENLRRLQLAYHEAGHAVVAIRLGPRLGRRVARVVVDPAKAGAEGAGEGFVELVPPSGPQTLDEAVGRAAVVLAGALNEPALTAALPGGRVDFGGQLTLHEPDVEHLQELLDGWVPVAEGEAGRRRFYEAALAEAVLAAQRPAVHALARALLDAPGGELGGLEAESVVVPWLRRAGLA